MTQSRNVGPGPAGTSCLTCKRRHKKCDLRRPVCERCESGGFECLGYSHNNRSSLVLPGSSRPRSILPKQAITNSLPAGRALSSSVQSEVGSSDCSTEINSSLRGNEDDVSSAPSSLRSGEGFKSTTKQLDRAGTLSNSDMFTTRNEQPLLTTRPPAEHSLGPTPSLRSLFKFYTQIPYVPYHLSKTLLDSVNLEDYVMSHCDRTLERVYFKPMRTQLAIIRNSFTSRLRASSITRWIMFLNATICESYFKGDTSQNTTYDLWLCQMEQVLRGALTENLAPSETRNRQGSCIEVRHGATQCYIPLCFDIWGLQVILLKAMIFHNSHLYHILRNATPTFFQILFSEPTLWSSNCDPTSVPLANVITSQRHELMYFVLVDIAAAMTLGLPQQVEYDTSLTCLPNAPAPHEWMHGSPIEFHMTLAEINACRDKSPNARDWKEIEHRLITWQARPNEYDASLESRMVVAWFAVQESWRHTLLAYLYMAVCRASSDDPRIQSSIRQIFLVIKTVKKPESSGLNVPFFIQSLMAGICARSEKHRSLARQHLVDLHATPQLMRPLDFVPVLDHLWHGAAADGRPITWSDYVCSRETTLPVLM